MGLRPIANKYHEGKMKRILERELKVSELAGRKADRAVWLDEIVVCYRACLVLQRKRRAEPLLWTQVLLLVL